MKKKLRNWFIPFIEKHIRTYHSDCPCLKLEGIFERDGVTLKIWYDGHMFELAKGDGDE